MGKNKPNYSESNIIASIDKFYVISNNLYKNQQINVQQKSTKVNENKPTSKIKWWLLIFLLIL